MTVVQLISQLSRFAGQHIVEGSITKGSFKLTIKDHKGKKKPVTVKG